MSVEKVRGFVEIIRPDEVAGWAFRPDRPDEHLLIEIHCNDEKIAEADASSFRADLLRANIGKGDHGFVIKLPVVLSPDALLSVRVVAVPTDGAPAIVPTLRTAPSPLPLPSARGTVPTDGAPVIVSDGMGLAPPCQTQIVARHITSSSPPLREIALNVVDEQQHPVFVLGAARSGTSAISTALLKTRYYQGFGEGHLLPLAHALVLTCASYYRDRSMALEQGTFIRQVPQNLFAMSIRAAFINLVRSTFASTHWLDKTPTKAMVYAAPLMREIWPNARFIFLRRRAVENVVSRMRKFPRTLFRDHCQDWAAVMEAWLNVRTELADAAIELDHLSLAREPAMIGKQVGDFLGLPRDVQDKFVNSLVSDRLEQTSEAPTSVYRLDELAWPSEDLKEFRTICGAMMKAYGYSFDDASPTATIQQKKKSVVSRPKE
jgi:hypothetical protein